MRPSDPLLAFLREAMKREGWNVARLAQTTGMERARLRKRLAGGEDMTVDELLRIVNALGVAPAELADSATPAPVGLRVMRPGNEVLQSEVDPVIGLDPNGNHPAQLFKVGFELGCDFFFFARTADLNDSGIPKDVLDRYRDDVVPLKLDAAYHHHHNPRFQDDHIALAMSFDAVYECRIPWHAIERVMFLPAPVELEPGDEEEAPSKGPHLRLVT